MAGREDHERREKNTQSTRDHEDASTLPESSRRSQRFAALDESDDKGDYPNEARTRCLGEGWRRK